MDGVATRSIESRHGAVVIIRSGLWINGNQAKLAAYVILDVPFIHSSCSPALLHSSRCIINTNKA